MNLDLPSAGHAAQTIIGPTLLIAGFGLSAFSGLTARENWKFAVALWLLFAALIQLAGVAIMLAAVLS